MRQLTIQNAAGNLVGKIFPDYGGMLGKLFYNGKAIICADENMLSTANLLAGGCPVLFPFPSRTADDRYTIDGKEYAMPFHGLVKNAAFGIQEATENSVTLYITNNETSMQEHFPFDFRLEVTYRMENGHVVFNAVVRNRSDRPMPHYFGWHHYFKVSDKSRLRYKIDMEEYVNYLDGTKRRYDSEIDFTKPGDYVFSKKHSNETKIINQADGYQVSIQTDDAFEALVVCTLFDGLVTAEPWLGTPNAINEGRYVKWVAPHTSESYTVTLELSEI